MTMQQGKYEAKVAVDADGWYRVSFGYNDGEQLAAVPGAKTQSYKTEKQAVAYAVRTLAKVS